MRSNNILSYYLDTLKLDLLSKLDLPLDPHQKTVRGNK